MAGWVDECLWAALGYVHYDMGPPASCIVVWIVWCICLACEIDIQKSIVVSVMIYAVKVCRRQVPQIW